MAQLNTYTTIQGDTWDIIAYKTLNDCKYMGEVMAANKQHIGTIVFSAGVTIVIPDIKTAAASTLPPWKK